MLAGALLAQLPERPVALAAAALFAIGAVVLVRGARRPEAAEQETEQAYAEKLAAPRSGWPRARLGRGHPLGTLADQEDEAVGRALCRGRCLRSSCDTDGDRGPHPLSG